MLLRRLLFLVLLLGLVMPTVSRAQMTGSGGSGVLPQSSCGDSTHALSWNGSGYGCQAITASAAPGGTSGQLQYNNAGALGGTGGGGDCTFTAPSTFTCTKTNGVAFAPSATTDTTNASNITSGTLPAAQLPNPSASTLGGIRSITAAAHNWINAISTSGVPSQTRPLCGDLSDAAASCSTDTTVATNITSGTLPAARLPNPSATTLGGIQSLASTPHQWINSVSTTGVPGATQPAFPDISGNIAVSQMGSGTGASASTFWRGDGSWQAVTASAAGVSGNPQVNSGGAISAVANEIHAGSGTLATAFAACPAGTTACTVVADPGQTYHISSPLSIGSSTKPETLLCDGATISCDDTTGGRDCIDIFEKGAIIGNGEANAAASTGCIITGSASANITSLVTNGNKTNQPGFSLQNVTLSPPGGGTVSKGALWLSSIDGFGRLYNVSVVGGPANSVQVFVDDGAAPGDLWNDIQFYGLTATGSFVSGIQGLKVVSAEGGGKNLAVFGGTIGDQEGKPFQAIVSGSGQITNLSLHEVYFEAGTSSTSDFITDTGVNSLILDDVNFTPNTGSNITNCIKINSGTPGMVKAWGRAAGSACTNTVNNIQSGKTIPNAGDFEYDYDGTNNGGHVFDPAITTGNGGMPAASSLNNLAIDNGTTWVNTSVGGSLCEGATIGDFELCAMDGMSFSGTAPSSSVAGQLRVTDGAGHWVTGGLTSDPTTAVGDIPMASNVGVSPHTFTKLADVAAGSVIESGGVGQAWTTAPHAQNIKVGTIGTVSLTSTGSMTDVLYIPTNETVNKINFVIGSTNACTGTMPIMSIVDCGTTDPSNGNQTAWCSSTTPITSSGSSNISAQIASAVANQQIVNVSWSGTLTLTAGHYYVGRVTGVGTACGNAAFTFDIQSTI